jgi:hypothetical protein
VFGGCGNALTTGVQIVKNVVGEVTPADGNDVGIWLANYDPTCSMAPSTTTNDKTISNTLTNIEITKPAATATRRAIRSGFSESGLNDR